MAKASEEALSGLVTYEGSDSDEDGDEEMPSTSSARADEMKLVLPAVNLAPAVAYKEELGGRLAVDPSANELSYNPTYDELFAPIMGPENVFKTDQQRSKKNTLTGAVEPAHFNDFQFENQRMAFDAFGLARDPSAESSHSLIVNPKQCPENKTEEKSVFDKKKVEKRKQNKNMDPSDVVNYTGPWAPFQDEQHVSKPDPETLKQMEEFRAKRKKVARSTKDQEVTEERSILHLKETTDYLGRSFMVAPQDVAVNLRADHAPDRCYLPKKQVHTFQGHNKGVQVIRWFPRTAHMLLSGSMDSKIKLWDVYKTRKCIRTYVGHRLVVRDLCFNNSGTEFISASFDRYLKLWDTETGECKLRLTTGKVPFCVKYNPDEDKQNMILVGMQDKRIMQWDLRSGEIIQEYDRHLGAVNSITFFDQNRRFCSTSDDKSLRIWEWEIPVDTKLIQDSGLHSMPTMTLSPNQKWLVGQSMDNRIMLFQVVDDKLRFAKKKAFRGHSTAGYACGVDFSPDMSYLVSGDADGRVVIWDWKTHKLLAKWKAHDQVCIGVLWHPHEASKVVSCGWDGMIKLWD